MRNIALIGAMGAGKTTISDLLVSDGYQKVSLAGPIKNIARLAYGEIDKGKEYNVTNPDGTRGLITGRQMLQGIGQSMKQVDKEFWLKILLRDSKNYLDQPLVIDDTRFLFELDALMGDNWLAVGINTPLEVRRERYEKLYGRRPSVSEETHESEVEIPKILTLCDMLVDGTTDPHEIAKLILSAV